jgi:uncharacterized protein (DUF433 family)
MINDQTEVPFYRIGTAARWVGVPPSTLEKWVYGRDYVVGSGVRHSDALINPADFDRGLLSFSNIAEAHILAATRGHGIKLSDIRAAIDIVQRSDPAALHPLLTGKFYRRGRKLFVDFLSEKISASSPNEGQRFLEHFDAHLDRLEIKRGGHIRLFPVRRNEQKIVVLNSDVAGGQPIIAGTGILVEYVQDLRKAGLSTAKIAGQYGLDEATIVQAIAYIAA